MPNAGSSTHIHENKARDRAFALSPPSAGNRASCASGIDKELPLQFIRLEPMRSAPQEHIAVQPSCLDQQAIAICLRHDSVAMGESYSEISMDDDLMNRQAGSLDVEVALDNLDIRSDAAEEFVGFFVGEVTETQDLADLAGC